ncbi:MAG TPA: response regulator [Candidatus Paceibacterota bacterium]
MKKILIIEDDVFLGDVLMRKLNNEGYETSIARDGKEGLTKIKEIKPDLVLLDIVLPSMNGYEILEEKVKDPAIEPIPVIIISNSGQPVEINRVLALGVKDYLIKAQFSPDEVLVKVRAQLGGEGATAASSANVSNSLKGKKILWVEDDKFLSDLISRKISTQSCTMVHTTNGEDALKALEKEIPDIILLDILLPGMNGFEILQKIKTNPAWRAIPVILLSNLGQQGDLEKAEKLGAKKFLIKATVTLDEILGEIKRSL